MSLSKLSSFDKLRALNKYVYEKEYFDSPLRVSVSLCMGHFGGDKILFIGQNPGQPQDYEDGFVDSQSSKLPFEEEQQDYLEGLKRCRIGKYLIKLCTNLSVDFEKDCSFTNVVKFATKDNAYPDKDSIESMHSILRKQMEYLQPMNVVAIGKLASEEMREEYIFTGKRFIVLVHPASHRYSGAELNNDIRRLHGQIR